MCSQHTPPPPHRSETRERARQRQLLSPDTCTGPVTVPNGLQASQGFTASRCEDSPHNHLPLVFVSVRTSLVTKLAAMALKTYARVRHNRVDGESPVIRKLVWCDTTGVLLQPGWWLCVRQACPTHQAPHCVISPPAGLCRTPTLWAPLAVP